MRESSYISTVVSFAEPERPCVAIQSDSFWTLDMTGAYYLFSPATHRSITIPLSKFTDARIFGKAHYLLTMVPIWHSSLF